MPRKEQTPKSHRHRDFKRTEVNDEKYIAVIEAVLEDLIENGSEILAAQMTLFRKSEFIRDLTSGERDPASLQEYLRSTELGQKMTELERRRAIGLLTFAAGYLTVTVTVSVL